MEIVNKAEDLVINSDLAGLKAKKKEIKENQDALKKYLERLDDLQFGRLNNLDVSYKIKYGEDV